MAKVIALSLYVYFIFVNQATSKVCNIQKYYQAIGKSNCTSQQFLPLCELPRQCQHVSLETLSAGYFREETNDVTYCTFPRMLVGENEFVECEKFGTHYPCPSNSSHLTLRSAIFDNDACNDCGPSQLSHVTAGPGFKCQNNNQYIILPQVLLYDNVPDCENGEDLCFDSNLKITGSCAKCYDGTVILETAFCDGIIDCPDLSDECSCKNSISVCNAVTPILSSVPRSCDPGQIDCGNGKCIDRSQVCDGKVDCDNQVDERSEYCGATLICPELTISNVTQECRCAETDCQDTNRNDRDIRVRHTTKRNVNNTCAKGERVKGIVKHRCIPWRDHSNESLKCNGIVECETSASDEENCPGKFLCRDFDKSWIVISERKVCDFVVDCADGSDELDCGDQRFFCKSDNLSFVRINQVRNGMIDCEDGSDECVEDENATNSYFFHSKSHLIENQVLYLLVWVMAFMSLTGNTVVIIRQVTKLIRRRRIDELSSLRANHILVLNLAATDLLMGVYLLGVGVNYERLKGSYCQEELLWRGSSVCTWLGITALISCEASVLTLIMLASCRLYAVLQPFRTSSTPKVWLVILLALFTWALSSVVASLPLTNAFQSLIPDEVLLSNNPFLDEPKVNLTTGKNFLIRSLVFYPSQDSQMLRELADQIQNSQTWDSLLQIYKSLPEERQELQVAARYGYYNIHSICLADFFPRPNSPYVALTLSLITFNFIAFLYIAMVYVSIYMISFKKKPTRCTEHSCDSVNMQRKIFRILVFNFVSWIPICILSFLRLSGTIEKFISGEVYLVAAIVFLPLNSAINPILYSDVVSIILRKMFGYADDFKRRTIRLASVDTTLSTGKTNTGSIRL